jgi:hypothetical protein
MDLKNFENEFFCKILTETLTNNTKKILKVLKHFFEDFFENILRIFPKNNHLSGQWWLRLACLHPKL